MENLSDITAKGYNTTNEKTLSGEAVALTDSYIEVMSGASEDSETVGRLYDYTLVYVDEAGSEWTQISSGNVTGYVKNASLCFGEEAEVIFNESAEEERELNAGYTVEEIEEKEAREEAERIAAEEAKKQEEENAKIQQAMQNAGVSYNPTMSASDEEVWLLATIVEWEAGAESYQGKLAVANVVLNRVRSSKYENSITGVIYAPKQFSGVTDGNGNLTSKFAARLAKGPASECLEAAMEALSGVNNVGSYTSFRALSIANYSSYDSYMIIGGHCFY
jgi:spore germination cell wall hydrolase CwlJ-like protein